MAAADSGAKSARPPYGIVGLCLSLVAAMVLALILLAGLVGAGFLATVPLLGWDGARAALAGIVDRLQGPDDFSAARLILGLLFYVGALAAIILLALWRGGRGWRDLLAWRAPVWPVQDKVLWALGAIGLVYGFASSALLGYFYPKSNDWFRMPSGHTADVILLILAVVMAPLAEEAYFRGWIYTSLRFRLGVWPAMLISAAAFGLAHYEATHLYALAVFPLGLVLAALRERTGSVRTSMLFHAVNNGIAFMAAAFGH